MRDRDDDAPVEHDPTGMRDLLARLPEPGPMPDDLVARITASLAQEARDGTPAGAPSHAGTGGQVLGMPPPRRSRWPLIGVAAAVIAVLGLGGLIAGTGPGGLTAALDLGSGGDSASDAGSAAQSAPGSGTDALARAATVVTWSGTDYDATHLATQAAVLATGADAAEGSGTTASDVVASPAGARSCADGLGVAPDAGLVLDVATFEGRPAAVLLVTGTGGESAYAVERSCSAESPTVIMGPVPVSP